MALVYSHITARFGFKTSHDAGVEDHVFHHLASLLDELEWVKACQVLHVDDDGDGGRTLTTQLLVESSSFHGIERKARSSELLALAGSSRDFECRGHRIRLSHLTEVAV